MKTNNSTPFFKFAAVVLFFTLFGFAQQVQAQNLTITNTSNCWIYLGEHAGNNCTICNNTQGMWVPPVTFAPANVVTLQYPCFTTSNGGGEWIGIKYAVASPFSPFPGPNVNALGATSYTSNPFNPSGPCFLSANNSSCGGPIIPFWAPGNNVFF